MHRRISHTLNTLRQGLAAKLGGDFIDHACRLAGHSWCDSCLLTPAAIIHWFLVQILHGNTALTHVSLLAGRAFTASAFCQARARLPLAVFRTVLREMVKALVSATETVGRWRGHRTFLVDGSSFSMPDTAVLQAHFGQPGNQAKGCGFPVAHMEAGSGTGPILKLGGPADVRAIFTRARHFDFGPPFAGDPWDDRPTLGPNVSRFPCAIPAGQRGGLVARCGEALPVPARRRFD